MKKPFYFYNVMMGCDPEFFFEGKDGKIVGAEKVLPADGRLGYLANRYDTTAYSDKTAFVLDGVQVELNPNAHHCRANLANELKVAFVALKKHLAGKDIKATFNSVIEIDKAELASLSKKSRQFGCAPSNNIYNPEMKVTANPSTYRKRAAGGHLHFGITKAFPSQEASGFPTMWSERERLIPLLDIFVGNTCVMIDRHPLAAERRKNYGRAGEYRLPNHGIEYRTLSNFWLRSYQLMSFVFGMSRIAQGVLYASIPLTPREAKEMAGDTLEAEILSSVDMEKIVRAINTNDLALAKENWAIVREFIKKNIPEDLAYSVALCPTRLDAFDYFLQKIEENEAILGPGRGIEFWFPQDPLEHWCNIPEGHETGWESWFWKTVVPAYTKSRAVAAPVQEARVNPPINIDQHL